MDNTELCTPFAESVKKIMAQMTCIDIILDGGFYKENDDIASNGVSSLITFSGAIKGRLLIDMEPSVAIAVAQNITGIAYATPKDNMVLASISELNNTIAGDGITELNNKYSLKLRLAPPIVFTGKDTVICIPKITSVSLNCGTEYGKFKFNIAFERSL